MGLGKIDYAGERIEGGVQITRARLRRVAGYFLPYRILIGVVFGLVALGAFVGLLPPLVIRTIIDQALPQRNDRQLGLLVLALVLLPLLEGALGVAQQYVNTRVGQGIMRDLRVQLFHHLQLMSIRFFTVAKAGDVISRATTDVASVQDVVSRIFINLATNVITIGSTLIVMFSLDWRLSVLSLLAFPILIAPVRRVGRIRQRLRRRTQEQYGRLTSILQEVFGISGALLVKVFTQEEHVERRFARESGELMQLEVKLNLIGRWFLMFISLAAPLTVAVVLWLGGLAVIRGAMTIGTVIAFMAYLGRLYTPFSQLLNVHIDLLTSLAVFERLFEYMDIEPEISDKIGAYPLPLVQGSVHFEHVSFSYDSNSGDWALHDVTFSVAPGQLVALVGPSGAGKTTIAYLLLRLYEPGEGTVRMDGHDIRDVSLRSLRAQIGVAMQETFLFHTTIRENLLFAAPEAAEEEIVRACRAAYIHDLIASLPRGYDTVVGERGYRLSAGEKQRIALARVFLRAPRILILDEATSAVDSQSEAYIQAAMKSLVRDRTTFVIAHRLSTILAAHLILVLDKGRLVESGAHQDLLAKKGFYSRLFRQQYATPVLADSGV